MAASASSLPSLSRHGLPRPLLELCERLGKAGKRAWLVGGAVRDSLLAELTEAPSASIWNSKDWDVATDAHPTEVMRLFRRVIPTGVEHGTVTVLLADLSVEVTTLRAEVGYRDGRRPDQVGFVDDIREDLARRDFTVNAIAFDPVSEQLIDPFEGLRDLVGRRLRAVGDAAERFAEDGLRVLRAARFVATLEFDLDQDTARAIRPSLDTYRKVSAERIREEWNKALRAQKPSRAFAVMLEHGLLSITAPELAALNEPAPPGGVSFEQALRHLDCAPRDLELRLAALLSRLAAQPAASAARADALLGQLRYSNAERKRVTRLVQHQQLPLAESSGAALRRWLRLVGVDLWEELCALERARIEGLTSAGEQARREGAWAALDAFAKRVRAELELKPALSLSELAIDGHHLIAEAGFAPGRAVGQALEALLLQVLEDPALNTPEQLLERARGLLQR